MTRAILASLFLLLFASVGNAATCYWIGGTGNFDSSNTASWASATGGTTGTCAATDGIPKNAGDIAVFDGSSGGGTITVCGASSANCPSGSGTLSLAQITCGAFTGTIDFSANNPTVTLTTAFNCSGTGTRTVSMGSSTFNLTSSGNNSPWNILDGTNMTFTAGTSTINMTGATCTNVRNWQGGQKTYNNITIDCGAASTSPVNIETQTTVANLTIGSNVRNLRLGTTVNITNSLSWACSQASMCYFGPEIGTAQQFNPSGAYSISWVAIQKINENGAGSLTCNNCIDLGDNSNVIINAPPFGGGGVISSGL